VVPCGAKFRWWQLAPETCTRTSSRTAHNCANDICSIEIDHVGYVVPVTVIDMPGIRVWPDVCVYAKVPVPLAPRRK